MRRHAVAMESTANSVGMESSKYYRSLRMSNDFEQVAYE